MSTADRPQSPPRASAGPPLFWGAIAVGTLDALDGIVFFGLRGVPPVRIFQSIASGLLGRSAFQGGLEVALLGVVLHFFIASLIVATCYGVGRLAPRLLARPLVAGPAYGVVAYAVMNYVVIPLSAARQAPFVWPVFVNGILIHMLGVGIPSVLAARAALGMGRSGSGK